MSEMRELYQQVILDHNKSPRNWGELAGANRVQEGFNPLCGDHLHVYLKLEDDTLRDIKFQGESCAICKASASIMTTLLKGRSRDEAQKIYETFHHLVTSDMNEEIDVEELGRLAVFAGVREFPARVKCASLAWHTMHAALEGEDVVVSTE